ncbi:MAG TPA: hypothetical protein VGJ20_07490 [Xanthobacteraceae bacterium]|jgi:hypothetical protein
MEQPETTVHDVLRIISKSGYRTGIAAGEPVVPARLRWFSRPSFEAPLAPPVAGRGAAVEVMVATNADERPTMPSRAVQISGEQASRACPQLPVPNAATAIEVSDNTVQTAQQGTLLEQDPGNEPPAVPGPMAFCSAIPSKKQSIILIADITSGSAADSAGAGSSMLGGAVLCPVFDQSG